MDTDYWKSSPFGEESIFHPSWEEKENEKILTNNISNKTPTISLESGQSKLLLPAGRSNIVRFKVSGISKRDIGGKYSVEINCIDHRVIISTNKFEVEEGWVFMTCLESEIVCDTSIAIYINKQICNSIPVKFLNSKDVFQEESIDLMLEELNYIKRYADKHVPPEYDENYCMQAAERALSVLLNNTVNFYSVVRDTHKHRNNIGFSGKTVYDRGDFFQKCGFVQHTHIFKNYKINPSELKLIYDSPTSQSAEAHYKEVLYKIVEVSEDERKKILEVFNKDLENKETGFHVYYFTVTNGFHTMLLIINNTDVSKPTYEMWDQHGLTSSYGPLKDIGLGFQNQTSWTFANSCLNRYNNHTTQYYDSTQTKLWKIKRK
ncbi:MAG: hypothetical protein IKO75_09150 [Bacteroidales bacterium]|nr:hypothetical protein [Bacteroidales bacterium]